MKYRVAWLAAILLSAASAHAYVYNVGPNYVNMPGSSCRTRNSTTESTVTHAAGDTRVNFTSRSQRLYCPIPRRGTSYYRGTRVAGSPELSDEPPSAFRVNINSVTVRGSDNSSGAGFSCFVFGTRMSDQAVFFGSTKTLCGTAGGCAGGFGGPLPPLSWKGTNTLQLSPPSNFNNVDTVNFGIACDVGGLSTLAYTETAITPSG